MQVSDLIEKELPENWRRACGKSRFARVAGLYEFCIDVVQGGTMWPDELLDLLDSTLKGGIKSVATLYEREGGPDFFPSERLLALSDAGGEGEVAKFGHTALTQANIVDVLDYNKAITPGSAILLAFAMTELVRRQPAKYPDDTRFEVRLAVFTLKNMPFSGHKDLLAQGKAKELKNMTAQTHPDFWDQIANGLPMTRDTAERVAKAIRKNWTPKQLDQFGSKPFAYAFKTDIPLHRPPATGSAKNKTRRMWYAEAERIILRD